MHIILFALFSSWKVNILLKFSKKKNLLFKINRGGSVFQSSLRKVIFHTIFKTNTKNSVITLQLKPCLFDIGIAERTQKIIVS